VLDAGPGDRRRPAGRGLPGSGRPASLADGLLATWTGEFGWLVVAEPLNGAEIALLATEASRAQQQSQRHDSPRAQLATRRASARHEELRRAMATGMWRIRLLAGGSSPHAAGSVHLDDDELRHANGRPKEQ
jgi:hypothetical protein